MLGRTQGSIPSDPGNNKPLDFYWTDAQVAEADDVHAKLGQVIAGLPGMRLYTADLYETDCGAPVGYVDLAIGSGMEKACGVFRQCCDFTEDDSTPAIWFSRQQTPHETLELFVEGLKFKGWI